MSDQEKITDLEKIKDDCCCEHDHEHEHHHHHHHDHDDDCCCEHGHEHEHHHHHHHDHDDDCCCEHDHEHEHHHHHHDHDDDCCCGHDHEHEHEHEHGHQYEVAGYNLVETHTHEGATVCSFEKPVAKAAEEAKKSMEEAVIALRDWLISVDALIGHVKGYIKENGPTTTFSTTGNEVNIETHEAQGVVVGFASIVFGPSEEELKDKVVEIFTRLK